jgi:parvulin-like peptidyl-prolyl isomerase
LRVWVVSGLALALLIAVVSCEAADPVANKESGAKKVVTFRGGEVTQAELQEEVELFSQSTGGEAPEPGTPEFEAAAQQVLPQVVNTEIAEAYAKEQGITVSEGDVDEEFQKIKTQVGEDAAAQAEAAGQQITPEEGFEQALQQANYTEERLREDIRSQLPVQKVSEEVAGDVEPTDDEVQSYYEENKEQFTNPEQRCARHILFNKDQEEKAQDIKAQIEDGGNFEELAKENSQDPGSKENGGDLGCQAEGAYVPNFENAVFEAEEGDLVGPVETEFGFHVIRVYDVQQENVTPIEEVRAQIADQLLQERQTEEFDAWVQEQIESRNVEYLEGYAPPEAPEPSIPSTQPAPEATTAE